MKLFLKYSVYTIDNNNKQRKEYMKTKFLISIFAIFGAVCFAQQQPPCKDCKAPPPHKAKMLKMFDKDGDGKLNDEEKALAKAHMEKKIAEFKEKRKQFVKKIVEKFDKDGDKKLCEDELSSFLDEQRKMFKKMRARKNHRLPKEIMAKFDKDGDGELNKEERKAMFEEIKARKAAFIKKFDKDGDGKLSDEEKAEMRNSPEFKERMKKRFGKGKTPPPQQ